MADKFLYIHNYDTQNYPFCTLQLMVETLGHSDLIKYKKVPKGFESTNKKMYLKTLGTSVINIPMSPPSLAKLLNNNH